MRIRNLWIALFGLSLTAACGRGENNVTPDAPPAPGDGSGSGGAVSVQDVQSESMAVNTAVELRGVVVTAVDRFGDRTASFWVQEPEGGAFSGVQIFVNRQTALLETLAPGDLVDVTSVIKTEFVLKNDAGVPIDMSGRTTTQLQAPTGGMLTVTKKGTATVPAPHLIDAVALDGMAAAARDQEYEKWESVLIEVRNVRSRAMPRSFGRTPFPEDTFEANISETLTLQSTQTKFIGIDGLTCFASITGVQDYFFDWLLLPRSEDDMVLGTECAAVTSVQTSITALQAVKPTGVIQLDDVYVTGVSNNKTSLWLSTSPIAAVNEGAYVFQSSSTIKLDPALVPGVKVSVIGTVDEFNDDEAGGTLTEIQPLRINVVTSAPVTLTPITELPVATPLTVSALLDPATAPTFESVLVTLANVRITALGASANGFIATAIQGGTTFRIGTDILQLKMTELGCYKTVTGFWINLQAVVATTKPNTFGLVIRDLGTPDGTCT
jgi:hypothetical protein